MTRPEKNIFVKETKWTTTCTQATQDLSSEAGNVAERTSWVQKTSCGQVRLAIKITIIESEVDLGSER